MPDEEYTLHMMTKIIHEAKNNKNSLIATVDNLIFLQAQLNGFYGENWEKSFSSQLANLESAYLASNEQKEQMGDDYFRLIMSSLSKLEFLVFFALNPHLKTVLDEES